jgi:hypothetical protein
VADLDHSDDYRIITFKGKRYELPPQRAAIVKVLHESRWYAASKQKIQHKTGCREIRDSFRTGHGPELWNNLIISCGKGSYRLNLTPKN